MALEWRGDKINWGRGVNGGGWLQGLWGFVYIYLVQATVEQPWVLYKVMLVVYNLLNNNLHSGLDWAA